MAARKDPEEIADAMGVDNAKKAKEDVASEILELELDHADRVSKFNRLHRCLAILLDQNLVDFALAGGTPVRLTLNEHAHPHRNRTSIEDASKNFSDIFRAFPRKPGGITDAHIRKQTMKLFTLLDDEKDYYQGEDIEVDNAIDELVDSEYRSRSVVASDVQILVLYFSKMFPEVLDRE